MFQEGSGHRKPMRSTLRSNFHCCLTRVVGKMVDRCLMHANGKIQGGVILRVQFYVRLEFLTSDTQEKPMVPSVKIRTLFY